ncbi:MAG: hypothetical protein ACE5LS_04700 [Thermoplasmata archaeon]
MAAFLIRDFLGALASRRLLAISVILATLVVVTGVALALVFLGIPTPDDGPPEGIPDPLEVWHSGGDGILTSIGFGLIPLLLPALPIALVSVSVARDRSSRLSELALSKPVPPWGPAVGKFIGLTAAASIPTIALSLGSAVAIQVVVGTPLNSELVTAFVVANLLLTALYLALALLLTTMFTPRTVTSLLILIWLGFNAIRQTAFILSARLATILGAEEALTFTTGVTDLVSFTGLYQGVLASAVPPALVFIISPEASLPLAQFASAAMPWASLAWLVGLVFAYAWLNRRVPTN